METAKLWFAAGGLEGPRQLPEPGGLLDQAAVMTDAFDVLRTAASRWRQEKLDAERDR